MSILFIHGISPSRLALSSVEVILKEVTAAWQKAAVLAYAQGDSCGRGKWAHVYCDNA